jgi:hypothetical protein
MKRLISAALLCLFIIGCNKNNDNRPHCDLNNYGFLVVSFGDSTIRHRIRVYQEQQVLFKEKIVEIGKVSDTVTFAGGSYPVTIASINGLGQVLQSENRVAAMATCVINSMSVDF